MKTKSYREQKTLNRIGRRIKQLRKEQNLTQKELAFKCDFEVKQVQRIEYAEVNCSVSHISAIAKALKLNLSEFFDFD
ncbi:MAG: helix-turn-helix transcriptional regulator [Bacteroidetes bacterium]|nr:helix-turn-helix transcriptional regulator [Bacteroidota bacterium]